MRWHTTFSHNVTSVLSENVVRVPAENSFQPTHSMIVQNRNLKLGTSHTQTPVHACDVSLPTSSPYWRHRLSGRNSQHAVLFPRHTNMCAWHSTWQHSLDRQCIRSCSHNSHLPWRRGRIDPYITTQMNGTHTIARRMSDEIKIWCINPQVST